MSYGWNGTGYFGWLMDWKGNWHLYDLAPRAAEEDANDGPDERTSFTHEHGRTREALEPVPRHELRR